jgi:tight adherence protein C
MKVIKPWRTYNEFLAPLDKKQYSLKRLLPLGLYLLDAIGYNLNSSLHRKLRWRIAELEGYKDSDYYLRVHLANKVVYALLAAAIVLMLVIIGGKLDYALIYFSLVFITVMFFLPDYLLKKRIKERHERIQMEFPDFINKMALLIGAGLPVTGAWEKVAKEGVKDTPLQRELMKSYIDIQSGKSTYRAYEDFAKCCRSPEVTRFVAAILQNMRKGNAELVSILNIQANECWEMRKHAARRLGEEAQTKLLLPLMLMLAAILLITVTPALLALQGL